MNYLRNKPVEIGVGRAINVERPAANIINGLIVKQHCNICVLQEGVRGKHTVVGFHHRCRNLRRWIYAESQLGFLAIIHREALQQKRSQAGPRSSSDCIEHQKPLQPRAVVRQLPDAIQAQIHYFFPNFQT